MLASLGDVIEMNSLFRTGSIQCNTIQRQRTLPEISAKARHRAGPCNPNNWELKVGIKFKANIGYVRSCPTEKERGWEGVYQHGKLLTPKISTVKCDSSFEVK